MYKFIVAALAAAIFVGSGVAASANPSNAFGLKNTSNRTLHFTYKCTAPDDAVSDHEAATIAAGAYMDYWFDGCSEYEIVKTTNDDDSGRSTTFRYTLTPGHQYEIGWDEDENAWNIHEM